MINCLIEDSGSFGCPIKPIFSQFKGDFGKGDIPSNNTTRETTNVKTLKVTSHIRAFFLGHKFPTFVKADTDILGILFASDLNADPL